MNYILFLKKIYFFELIYKVGLPLMLGIYLGLFTNLNQTIYALLSPYLPLPNEADQSFVLIDASDASMEQIYTISQTIQRYQPEQIIMDISHKGKLRKKDMERLKSSKTLFIFPQFKYEQYDNMDQNIKFYDFKHLYGDSSPTHKGMESSQLYPKHLINYNGTPSFSRLHSQDFFEHNVIAKLFKDKIVILSNFDNCYAPTSNFFKKQEAFEHPMHLALMLKGEMTQSYLRSFEPFSYYLFLFGIIIVWILFAYIASNYSINYPIISSVVLPLIFYALALSYGNFLLPISEMITSLLVITVLLYRHWEDIKDEEQMNVLDNLTKRLQDRVIHKTFFNSEHYWNDIMLLLNELFYLEKNIILQKVEGDNHLKEVASYQCDFSDIGELRRDYTREPYKSALENQSIMKPTRNFFENLKKGEAEYIIPLLHHNKVIGFWAFSLMASNIKKEESFLRLLEDFAKEVSHLLFKRSKFIENRIGKEQEIEKLLNVEVRSKVVQNIENNLAIIEKRMLMDEVTLDTIHTHIVVYDLFGRVIQINEPMARTLHEEKISVYRLTPSEMLFELSSMTLQKSKEMIREVISTKQSYTQLVTFNHSKKQYIFTLSPMTKEHVDNKFTIDYFLDTCGIICEFHNFSYVEHRYYYKRDIINQTLEHNQERLRAIEKLAIPNKQLSAILYDMIFSFNRLKVLTEQDIVSVSDDLYPLDILKVVHLACDTIERRYVNKPITFAIDSHIKLPLVMLSIHNAQRYIQHLLAILVEDSQENATVSIKFNVHDHTHSVIISMRSSGVGMPQEQLQNFLSSSSAPQKYRLAQEVQAGISEAMGKISFSSRLGDGIRIEMHLKSVNL